LEKDGPQALGIGAISACLAQSAIHSAIFARVLDFLFSHFEVMTLEIGV
jgi:hypothetical protein